MVHKYSHPGVYLVLVECSTSEWHVTVQKTITIQEPVGEFGVIKCYSQNHSTDGANCKGLYGTLLRIQVEVEAGGYYLNQRNPTLTNLGPNLERLRQHFCQQVQM